MSVTLTLNGFCYCYSSVSLPLSRWSESKGKSSCASHSILKELVLLHSALIIIFVVSEKSQTKILLFLFEGISVGAEWCETVGTAHMEQGLVRARRLEALHH